MVKFVNFWWKSVTLYVILLSQSNFKFSNKILTTVQGNLSGQNEFVVYNMYRVMPEYVIEYTDCAPAAAGFIRFSKPPMKKTSARKKSTTTATKRKRKK